MSTAVDLRPTAGAALIGVFISTAMYGLTTFQMYHYYQLSWRVDSWWIKAYVFYVWCLETLHAFLCCAFVYRFAIINFGNYAAFAVTSKSDDVVTGVTGLIMLSVHLFYVRRLWILSDKNILLVGLVTLLAFGHFALEMVVMAVTFKFPQFTEFHRVTAYYTGSLALAAADDIIIAVSLCYLLYTRRTGIRSTDTLVNRIITYSVMTGAVTSVIDLAILICFITMPNNLVYLGLYDFAPNLYANSLLAMLNARDALQKMAAASTTGSALTGTSTFALGDLRGGSGPAIAVAMGDSERSRETNGPPRLRRVEPVTSKIAFAYPGTTTTDLTDESYLDA
ncbi:hypothetical protein BD413DRAFT_615364 [Trametes elegans]|nr:hypothetical protein BD413DRAFT_615364 [Trametes elegans]